MKLFYSPTSPYVRKVMACAITRGVDGGIEKVPCNPHASPAELSAWLARQSGVLLFLQQPRQHAFQMSGREAAIRQ